MKRKSFIAIGLIMFLFFVLSDHTVVNGAEDTETVNETQKNIEHNMLDEFDFSELDTVIKETIPDSKVKFTDVLDLFLCGRISDACSMLYQYLKEQISYEFVQNKKQLMYMVFIALTAAFFSVFCHALGSKQAAEVSFYILYAFLMLLCIQTFQTALTGVEEHLKKILLFMKVFYPCYFTAMAIAAGSMSAMFFYEVIVFLVFITEVIILNVAVPVIRIYIMIRVLDYMTAEEKFSEFAKLLKTGIEWSMKALLGIIVGLNVVQGLLNPILDAMKRNSLAKTVEALPGVGNVFGSVTDLLLGTAVLIKNGIGLSGGAFLLLLCAVPIVQNIVLLFLYKTAAAAVQPISDKRIVKCIRSIAEGYELMLKVLVTTMLLFLLTIAITAATTSRI